MSMGIIMKGVNSLYFRKGLDFAFEFIPQIILILALFGWMDLLIIGKWLTPKNVEEIYDVKSTDPLVIEQYNAVARAPPIITSMIDMFLNFGSNMNGE